MIRFQLNKNQFSQWIGMVGILCLFLGLLLSLINLESQLAIWSRWSPMILIQVSCLILFIQNFSILHLRPVHWMGLLILSIPIFCRASIMLEGILPRQGFHEAHDLVLIWFCCVATWFHAVHRPSFMICIWSMLIPISILLENLISGFYQEDWMLFRSDYWNSGRIIGLFSCIAGCLIVIYHRHLADRRTGPVFRPRPGINFFRRSLIQLLFLTAGGLAGWSLHSYRMDRPIDQAIGLERGLDAIQSLWLQSAAVGWGHNTLSSLMEVAALPHSSKMPEWAGPAGFPATHGCLGVAILMILTILLVIQTRKNRADKEGSPNLAEIPSWAACISLFLISLIVAGGPPGPLPLFFLGGWLALSFIPLPSHPRSRVHSGIMSFFMPALVWVCMLGLTLIMLGPLRGQSIYSGMDMRNQRPEQIRTQLRKARELNRFDARIPIAIADTWQKTMTRTSGWQENIFNQVNYFYREASNMDPYNTLIPLRHANFLLKCERQDKAVDIVRKALDHNPRASELVKWLFLVALRHDYDKLGFEMLDYGLKLEPYNPYWWRWRHRLTVRLGQGPLTRQSLAIALTGNPENQGLISMTWKTQTDEILHSPIPTVPGLSIPPEETGSPVQAEQDR
jgi:hypothetical protein